MSKYRCRMFLITTASQFAAQRVNINTTLSPKSSICTALGDLWMKSITDLFLGSFPELWEYLKLCKTFPSLIWLKAYALKKTHICNLLLYTGNWNFLNQSSCALTCPLFYFCLPVSRFPLIDGCCNYTKWCVLLMKISSLLAF